MTQASENRIVSATREIAAPAAAIFELIADPARQPEWDGNDNLAASSSPRVRAAGEVFVMNNTSGKVKENHVTEFEEGRRIGWQPADSGKTPPGHLWLWELQPVSDAVTRVTHTYDWTRLTDAEPKRLDRARSFTADSLAASLDRLAALAERA